MPAQDPIFLANHSLPMGVPQITMFYDRSGNIPFWDDPSVYGGIDRPDNYQPRLDMMTTVADFYHKRFLEEDEVILALIRDAIVLNENQLRRLLHGKMSSYRLSNRIRHMAIYGYTDRWKLKSRVEGVTPPPSPWSVGLGGYLYLKHRFPDFVMNPEKLMTLGTKAIQRYVAVNEIRTQLYEFQALKGWKWHSVVGNNPRLGKPLAVGAMDGPKGEILLLFNRLQQGQAYMTHLMERLQNWNAVFMQNNLQLPVMDFPKRPVVAAISVSTLSLAQSVAEKIPIGEFKIPIWFIIDEFLEKEKLPNAVYSMNPEGLKKVPLSWLKPRITKEDDE